jgi:rSAM/selenodomain-associated transferase 1
VSRPIVAVVARAPSAGGKTRLLGSLRTTDAAGLRRALLIDTLEAIEGVDEVDKAVVFTPAGAGPEIDALLPFAARCLPQRGDSLGDRMRHAIDDLLPSASSVILVGSDLPTLPPRFVSRAATLLEERRDRIVIGPADDGGYYLVGMSAACDALFGAMPWGTSGMLALTLSAAAAAHREVALLPRWYDVDAPADFARVERDATEDGGAARARHTRAWIAAHRRA